MTKGIVHIANLSHDAGYWQATITSDGDKVDVDRRYGSWTALVPHEDLNVVARCEVPAWVAAALQDKVRHIEKRSLKAVRSRLVARDAQGGNVL